MKKRTIIAVCLLFTILIPLFAANPDFDPMDKVYLLEGNPLHLISAFDGVAYQNHDLTEEEQFVFRFVFKCMPDAFQNVFEKKLEAVFFVEGMNYGGLTTPVVLMDGTKHYFMYLNADTMRIDMSSWLEYRDNTCLAGTTDDTRFKVTVEGDALSGFMHTLLHETAHLYDYVNIITPYVTDELKGSENKNSPYYDVWKDRKTPLFRFNTSNRNNISFYGFDDQKDVTQGKKLLTWLKKAPFSSLYGSANWADDFAETVTFYWLNKAFDLDYTVSWIENGEEKASYRWSQNKALKRWYPLCAEICGM